MPSLFSSKLKPYIHFLVIEKKTRCDPSATTPRGTRLSMRRSTSNRPSARPSLQPNEFAFPVPEAKDDLRKKIDELAAQVNV